jgi:hypothetical protein
LNELLALSADFKQFWDASETTGTSSYRPILLHMNLPDIGIVNFESVRMMAAQTPTGSFRSMSRSILRE